MRTVPITETVVSSNVSPSTTPTLELLSLLRGRRLSPEADADVVRLLTTGTDAEIRAVVAHLRHLPPVDVTVAEQYDEYLRAKADAATCAAIAAQQYPDQDDDHRDGGAVPRVSRCGVLLERVRGGRLEYVRADCRMRSCAVCGPRWYAVKLDRLTALLDGSQDVWVALVADADWRRTQARWSRRDGVGWCAIPTPDGCRFVVVTQPDALLDDLELASAETALQAAGTALQAGLEPGAPTTGKVSFGGSWRSVESTQATVSMDSTTATTKADTMPCEWTGVVTKATKLETVARHAERLGMSVAQVDADDPDAGLVIAGDNAVTRAALRERLGVMTWTELAEHRASRRADAQIRALIASRRAEMRAPKGNA